MSPDPWQWISDNVPWIFSGIGVVIATAIFGFAWRTATQSKAKPAEPPVPPPPDEDIGVKLKKVKARSAEISQITAPDAGVVIDGSEFSEDLSIHEIAVGQRTGQQASPAPAAQINNTTARDIHVGDKVYQAPPDPSKPDPAALERAYLERLYQQANTLALAGIDPKVAADADTRLELAAIYTTLLARDPDPDAESTTTRHDKEKVTNVRESERDRSVVALLNQSRRLVLLGDPGSGKTTFVNFATLCLSGARLGDKHADLDLFVTPLRPSAHWGLEHESALRPWRHGALLPVRIILRDFAARGLPDEYSIHGAESVLQFLYFELAECGLGAYGPLLRKYLLEEGGLVLFDGLDEVPEADRRRVYIKQAVDDFARTFKLCRILVTSRTYAYQHQEWKLTGFTETVLEPFSRLQISTFVDRWYAHIAAMRSLDPIDARGRAGLLKAAIFANDRLYALAERPLLLTLMASLHAWRGGTLPDKRVDLYADAVSLLMDWWESLRVVRNERSETVLIQPSLVETLKVGRAPILAQLGRLAYEAHNRQPALTGTADIAESDLVAALLDISQNPNVKPRLLVEYLSNRAGLLTPRGVKVFTFPHRTFQEYLAACHLTGDEFFPDAVAELARTDPNRWREVALLAGAKAAGGTTFAIWSLVDALCVKCRPVVVLPTF